MKTARQAHEQAVRAGRDPGTPRTFRWNALFLTLLGAMSTTAMPAQAQTAISIDNSTPINQHTPNNGYIFGIYENQLGAAGAANSAGSPMLNTITINNNAAIVVSTATQVIGGAGIWATDQGGPAGILYGGSGGFTGGASSSVTLSNNANTSVSLTGSTGAAGMQGMSIGGAGVGVGAGGNSDAVTVTNNHLLSLQWTWQNTSGANSGVYGLLALSQGGAGGITNTQLFNDAGNGGNAGAITVTLNPYGDVSATAYGDRPATPGVPSGAVVAASFGGVGGSALQGNGNTGGAGGNTGLITITHADANVTAYGDFMPGVVAYGLGGAGGNGGDPNNTSGFLNPSQNGNSGGSTPGATVTVSSVNRNTTISTTSYGPGNAPAVVAEQLGGAGGYGGYSHDTGGSTAKGGQGGRGGNAGPVQITTTSSAFNTLNLTTAANNSPGIYGVSLGGAGGYGGGADTGAAGKAYAGSGGAGGSAGDVTITTAFVAGNVGAQPVIITTQHSNSPVIIARSEGGIGGIGGYGSVGTGLGYGGNGGTGGSSGNVSVLISPFTQLNSTYGSASMGILAQSISGAGGSTPGFNGGAGGNGGTPGPGGTAGWVNVEFAGQITTAGDFSRGILAQSMAGAGGSGGSSWSVLHSAASGGASGGAAGAVSVLNTGTITTAGNSAQGVLLQSIGGGGGAGGDSSGLFDNAGGAGGNASHGGNVTYTSALAGGSIPVITTSGSNAMGILAQSIGGSGGDGGNASGQLLTIGGNAGNASTGGGSVTASVGPGSRISTLGDTAHGAVFQSIGGGGGNAGNATGASVAVSVNIGGVGGSAGAGGAVDVGLNQASITTAGNKAVGLVAQSIGGGGGTGGSANGTSIGPGFSTSVSVGGAGGSGSNGGGTVGVTLTGSSITTGQTASLLGPSSAPHEICPGTSNGACNVQPVDSFGVVVQSIGGGGGHGGNASAKAIAIAVPVSGGNQAGLAMSVAVGGNGGSGGNGGLAMLSLSNGSTITTHGNGASGALVQSIGGGGGDGGDSSAMAATVGYASTLGEDTSSSGFEVTSTVAGTGGGAGYGGAVQVALGGTTGADGSFNADGNLNPTYIQTFGDYAAGIKAQSIGGGGGDAGTGSGNTQNFGTKTTTSVSFNVGRGGSPGGDGGDVTAYLYPGNGIQTWGSAALGIIAQSIGGGGGTSQGGSFSLAQSDGDGSKKPGMNVALGNQTSEIGGKGGSVLVSVESPITTHGNDATGVLAQSIGGGGGLGGASSTDGSGDNPILQAMQGREFLTNVTNWLDDPNGGGPQVNTTMNIAVGGTGGTGGDGGAVTVWLASQISTVGNPIVQGGNQVASSGDWAHGIVAQSIGGGGGKGGTGEASGAGGDWAEYNHSYNVAVGGTGGSGGNGGAVTVNLQDNGAVLTKGYGATAVVAQSIGGGGGMGADGSDMLGGEVSVGASGGGSGGSAGSGGSITINEFGNLGSSLTTGGTFADGINAQSIGGGGGIGGAGSGIWGAVGGPAGHVQASMKFTAGGGTASSGSGGSVSINPDFANNPLNVYVSGYGAYGILAQSIGGGGGNLIANLSGSGTPVTQLGGLSSTNTATGGPVLVQLTSPSNITASGTAGIAVLAQSIGSGGGIIRVNDAANATPSLVTGGNPAYTTQTSVGNSQGGPVTVTSYATINANGPGGIGIFAQSLGGGGGLILNGSTLYAGVPLLPSCSNGCVAPPSNSTESAQVTLLANSVSARGTNGIGIFAQTASFAPIPDGAANVVIGDGNPGNTVTVTGGTGGAAIWVDRPSGGPGYSQGWVKVQEGGVVTTSTGSGGLAVNATGGGMVMVSNLGSITGSLSLESGTYSNYGGSWDPGPLNSSGMLQSEHGSLLNIGTWVPGAFARADILNQGSIAFDNAAMTTNVQGRFIQTGAGRLSPVIDYLNNRASLLKVDGNASVDGVIAPNAISLLPGTVPVFISSILTTTAQAQDSLLFDWDARTSANNTITLTPNAGFKPDGVNLSSSQSSLASYYARGWGNSDRGLATMFGGLSHINDGGTYKKTLSNLSSKATQAQTMAVIESASTILGAGMSCPVFIGDSVQLGENNCVWGQINGRWTDQGSTSDIQGYHVSGTTYRIGAQHQVMPDWYVGGSLAASQTWARMNGGSTGDGDTYDGSLTLKHVRGPWYFAGSLAAATGSFDNHRQVNAFGDSVSLKSKPSIFLGGARFRAGYEFDRGDWYMRPYGDVDVVYTHAPGFKESGVGPYALKVRSTDQTNVSFSPMLEFGRRGEIDAKTTIRAYAAFGMSWRPDNTHTVRSSFVGADSSTGTFTDYIKSPKVLGKVDLGLQLFRKDGYEVRMGYTADIGSSFLSQTASARFAYHF